LKVIEEDEKKFLRVPYLLTGLQDMRKVRTAVDPSSISGPNKALF